MLSIWMLSLSTTDFIFKIHQLATLGEGCNTTLRDMLKRAAKEAISHLEHMQIKLLSVEATVHNRWTSTTQF